MDSGKGSDRISQLPDEILMRLVSTMGMKEAARTSILSKQWRYLWTKGTTHLDFNPLIVLPDFDVEYRCFPSRAIKNKYINWVNQVVDLHNSSPCINTFRVCFGFERGDAHHIDKWVRFAISKQVKNLELCGSALRKSLYRLTLDIVDPSLQISISFLQSLCLKEINVTGDVIEYVLKQCCFLERLHIECSQILVRLNVEGGFCRKLKHLTILYCVFLEQLEIDEAVNLVYLHLSGKDRWSNFVFNNIPNLVDASFYGPRVSDFAPIFRRNSHLAQISKLSLEMKLDGVLSAGSLPTFCNLNQLTMMVDDAFEDEFIPSINQFLKACPKLCEFKVEFTDVDVDRLFDDAHQLNELDLYDDDDDDDDDDDEEEEEEEEEDEDEDEEDENSRWEYFEVRYKMKLERHPNLREFQVAGFYGCAEDVGLILLIVLISCNLETIICDCSHRHGSIDREITEVTEVLKSRAAILVQSVSLVTGRHL